MVCVIFQFAGGLVLATALLGCAARAPRSQPQPVIDRSYVDLQPGWRIRTVSPILRSPISKLEIKETKLAGGGVAYAAGNDLLGYETSFYAVTRGKDSGVAIAFVSSEVTIDGKTSSQSHPKLSLFEFPTWTRYVRLVFLTRISSADHNQAVLAASSLADLDKLTQRVEDDPSSACVSQAETYCVWVPQGSAVRPEERDPANRRNWVPVL